MGTAQVVFSSIFIIIGSISLLALPYTCQAQELKACGFDAMYILGDSISDTGNAIQKEPTTAGSKFPNGRAINKVTGRISDGLLIVDYLAQAAGLPLVDAYLNRNAKNFSSGVNFAYTGASTLSKDVLQQYGYGFTFNNISLKDELQWLDTYLKGFCLDNGDCKEKLKSSLFLVNIGANDYFLGIINQKTMEDLRTKIVPAVVEATSNGIKKLITYRATRVLVSGLIHFGCTPAGVAIQTKDAVAFDNFHCRKDRNDLMKHHNEQLQVALEKLRKEHPNVHIVYADVYGALQSLLDNSKTLGIKSITSSCCENALRGNCGDSGTSVCFDSRQYIFWDGGHLTQNTNMLITKRLIKDIYSKFQCNA